VGEETTVVFARASVRISQVKPQQFYQEAQPTWKKWASRFKLGAAQEFVYTFSYES